MRKSLCAAATAVTVTMASLFAAPSPGSAAPASEQAEPAGTTTITLITGDRITVTTMPGGERSILADPDGPSRGGLSLHRENGDTFAVPLTARTGLTAGVLDQQLFNVDELIRSGYDDTSRTSIPVILAGTGEDTLPTIRTATKRHTLESIGSLAVTVTKTRADGFWAGYDTPAERRTAGVDKIWLDSRVEADLAESVPQIGTPTAWNTGLKGAGVTVAVLDTGVDASHPDLTGQVTAAKNFTPSADAGDHFGHGTHVAATIAGTGAGPKGTPGVAPQAKILNGKVLGDDGGGELSDIIDGMEWAADTGADVINMSLGTSVPDNGTGPLSAALDRISTATGAFFVVASGNSGRTQGIGQPASASTALTVGAVDKADALASFSTRGPRIGDHAVKPEITAPGVDIVAARAEGTTMGTPVDDLYTSASGTSMATPHVAGVAALLAQQHPDWDPATLKSALVTTAKPGDYTAANGGAGRVDVARLVTQQAFATPAALNLGAVRYREAGTYEPLSKSVTLHNDADHDRTFAVKVEGGAAFTLDNASVTVPAGQTAQVTVTVDANLLPIDAYYTGVLTATAADAALRIPYSIHIEPLLYEIAVTGTGRDGVAAGGPSRIALYNEGGALRIYQASFGPDGVAKIRARPGNYFLQTEIYTPDADRNWIDDLTSGFKPSLVVDRDLAFTYDARTAQEIQIDTGRETERRGGAISYYRSVQTGTYHDIATLVSPDVKHLYAFPSPAPAAGTHEIAVTSSLTAPVLLAKSRGLTLTPTTLTGAKSFDGTRTLKVADLGDGTTVRNARGRLALVTQTQDVPIATVIDNAAKSGAVAVAIANRTPGRLVAEAGSQAIPAFGLTGSQGAELRRHPAAVTLTGVAYSPWQYDLVNSFTGPIGDGEIHFPVDATNTTEITAKVYAHGRATGTFRQASKRAWSYYYIAVATPVRLGAVHEQWVSTDPSTRYQSGFAFGDVGYAMFDQTWHSYTAGSHPTVNWFKQVANPTRTGASLYQAYSSARGNYLSVGANPFPDSDPTHLSLSLAVDQHTLTVTRGDTVIGTTDYFTGTWNFDATPGEYRAVLESTRQFDGWTFSPHTTTAWTFAVAGPVTGSAKYFAAPSLAYDVPVGLDNKIKGGQTHTVIVRATPRVSSDPVVTSVQTWASYNDGKSWTEVAVAADGTAVLTVPKANRTSGFVSLRTRATEAGGNTIDQTVDRAFGVR